MLFGGKGCQLPGWKPPTDFFPGLGWSRGWLSLQPGMLFGGKGCQLPGWKPPTDFFQGCGGPGGGFPCSLACFLVERGVSCQGGNLQLTFSRAGVVQGVAFLAAWHAFWWKGVSAARVETSN